MKNQSTKKYQIFTVKTNPQDISELGHDLEYRIKIIQEVGWKIERIDIVNDHYTFDQATYERVITPYYVIIAWREES